MSGLKLIGANNKEFRIEMDKTLNSGLFDGDEFSWDVIKVKDNL